MQRLNLDPRFSMVLLGGVLGVVLVGAILGSRGAGASPYDDGLGYPAFSVPPVPYEPLGPDGLLAAYEKLRKASAAGYPVSLSVARADDLVLPSGRVIAADAYILDASPATVTLAPGRYSVTLLQVLGADGPAIAAAMVRTGGEPVRWQEAPGYAVDSGTAAFASPEALMALRSLSSRDRDAILESLSDEYDPSRGYVLTAALTLDPRSGANLVSFVAGYGDGVYPAWFGFDASDRPVAMLTSFELLDDPSRPTSPNPSGSASPSR